LNPVSLAWLCAERLAPGVGTCFCHVGGIDIQIHFREATTVTSKKAILLSISISGCIVAFGLLAQQTATEAPAGFDTPTLQVQNAGSQSFSNGIAEPPGDTYAFDQQIFERREDPSLGLGPVFTLRLAPNAIRTQSPVDRARSPRSA